MKGISTKLRFTIAIIATLHLLSNGSCKMSEEEQDHHGLTLSRKSYCHLRWFPQPAELFCGISLELVKELRTKGFQVTGTQPKVYCKVFEDNSGKTEITTVHKVRPRTKHMNVQWHHFRHYVDTKEITIHAIKSEDQPADMMTKSIPLGLLQKFRYIIMGW